MNFGSTIVNVARFARNVEWDFFYDFQTQWSSSCAKMVENQLNF